MHTDGKRRTRGKRHTPLRFILISAALPLCICSCAPKGCADYTVQMKQYFVEYSDEYDYWDVLTVEYPQLADTEAEYEAHANELLRGAAMDRVNYWHLSPDEDVQAFQREHFSIFCSDVACSIPFHSQYLLSADYRELYSAGNPVWYTSQTERTLNLDLTTGEVYELADIIRIDEAFIRLWCGAAGTKYGDAFEGTKEETALFLSWFLNEDDEMKELYDLHTFFYPTGQDSFVIGFAYDPKPAAIGTAATGPQDDTYCVELETSALAPFRTDSPFWDKYDSSEETGRIEACEDKQENLWLGKGASVWDYWDEQR